MTVATEIGSPTVERILGGFVVILGAQRCGSTLLHGLLDDHPEISMVKPARPEPKIFLDPDLTRAGLRSLLENHRKSLDPAARLFGEKSTSYIESPAAAAALDRLVPGAELVVILRNPIDRAVSNYRFSVANGLERDPMDVALSRELEGRRPEAVSGVSVSPFAYLGRGRYIDHLIRYEEQFGTGRLHIVLFEELIERPDTIGTLYHRLGVDPSFRPGRTNAVNATVGKPPDLSQALLGRLRRYFRSANLELAERFEVDISRWT